MKIRRDRWLGPILLGAALCLNLLSGCADFGDFIGDSETYANNPNRPLGDSETMRRVVGLSTAPKPLQTETGNVWPTSVELAPTLRDLRGDMSSIKGTPIPAGSTNPDTTAARRKGPGAGGGEAPQPIPGQPNGILIPNGNGTSTLIRPDGTVTTIPTPGGGKPPAAGPAPIVPLPGTPGAPSTATPPATGTPAPSTATTPTPTTPPATTTPSTTTPSTTTPSATTPSTTTTPSQ